jgi:chitinase
MISYDDPESIEHKLDYILDNGLAGAMYWEMSGDTASQALNQQIADALIP